MHACPVHVKITVGVRKLQKASNADVQEIMEEPRAPVGNMQIQ